MDHFGFFIWTKLVAYTIFLEDISTSLILLIQKHPNFQQFLPVKFQFSSGDMCTLREPLEDICRTEVQTLLFIIIIIIIIIIGINNNDDNNNYYYYYYYCYCYYHYYYYYYYYYCYYYCYSDNELSVKLHIGIDNEIKIVIVPYHRKESPWGKSVKGYFGVVFSFVRLRVASTNQIWYPIYSSNPKKTFESLFLYQSW